MATCCCFSPVKTTLVFAGMQDGSLVAWDLRESPTMHHSYISAGKDWLLRFPTYNTAGVLSYENHTSPVTALIPIVIESYKASAQGNMNVAPRKDYVIFHSFCYTLSESVNAL